MYLRVCFQDNKSVSYKDISVRSFADKKDMLFAFTLLLPIYIVITLIWLRHGYVLNVMCGFEEFEKFMHDDDKHCVDGADTPDEGAGQCIKCNALKTVIYQGKAQLLGDGKKPWICECI